MPPISPNVQTTFQDDDLQAKEELYTVDQLLERKENNKNWLTGVSAKSGLVWTAITTNENSHRLNDRVRRGGGEDIQSISYENERKFKKSACRCGVANQHHC